MNTLRFGAALVFASLLAMAGARAQGAPSATVFIAEGGVTTHDTYSLSAGVAWPLSWHRISHNGEWTANLEAFASHWSSRFGGSREGFTQVGLVPVARYRFDHGRSEWFAEGGIGLSYMDRLYRTQDKQFSTRFNFYDTIGIGRSFGDHRENELSLRFAHVSNAGIKEPNPGENFFQLRYGRQF
jgi:lipid A 3-O-deacylase